jgi:hypothetical protein
MLCPFRNEPLKARQALRDLLIGLLDIQVVAVAGAAQEFRQLFGPVWTRARIRVRLIDEFVVGELGLHIEVGETRLSRKLL